MSKSRLTTALVNAAFALPEKTAVQDYTGNSVSFRELENESRRICAGLAHLGVKSGDRVALISTNTIEAIAAFWGILRSGAVAVWIDEKKNEDELGTIIEDCLPKIILSNSRMPHGHRDRDELPSPTARTISQVSDSGDPDGSDVESDVPREDDLAVIIYTSGSSGTAKGVCLTHGNLAHVAGAVVEHMPITEDDSYLMLVPLHYVHGLLQLLVHTLARATIHLSTGFQFPRLITRQIRDSRVSGFSGVPFHFSALIERGGLLDEPLPDLRWVTSTGGTVGTRTIKEFVAALPHVGFHIAYGQTECSPRATALNPAKILQKPDSVGSPIPGVTVQILDEEGAQLAAGSTGEIVISGPGVMRGYWGDPERTRAAIDASGRLHTGDLGHFDDEGDLYLDGRISELIKTAGERISTAEIEAVLMQHDTVLEAVVQSAPHPRYGEIMVANVCVDSGQSPSDFDALVHQLHTNCVTKTSFARSPRMYAIWSEFPRLRNGKVDRQSVSARSAAANGGEHGPICRIRPGRDA